MLETPQVFSPFQDYNAVDMVETAKVLEGIWGDTVTINEIKTKDQHCVMFRYASGCARIQKVTSTDVLLQISKKSSEYRDQDLYIAKNTYVNRTTHFETATIFGLRNICIDIDNHDQVFSLEDVCGTVNILMQDLLESYSEYGIPLPSAVVYTGRGLQLWYFLESVPKKLCFISTAIAEKLCDRYDLLLQDSPITYDGFEVDRAASTRASGLYRLPGSYNHSAQCFAQGKLWSSKRWDINDLKDELGVTFCYDDIKATPQDRTSMACNDDIPNRRVNNNSTHLLPFLHEVAESGKFESREVLCHIYHAMLLGYGVDEVEASNKVHELNDVFTMPLKERELVALIKCNEKHHYRYREATIFDRIGVPDDMIADYNAKKKAQKKPRDYKKENAARDNQRLEDRIAWHNEIRELRNQGYSISAISRITGHAWKTVKEYADTPMERDKNAARAETQTISISEAKEQVIRLYKRGFRSTEKIARMLEVDESQTKTLIEEYKANKLKSAKSALASTEKYKNNRTA